MSDLFDYLRWRGDLSFAQVPPGPVDALIFSALTYLTLEGSVRQRPDIPISLRDVSEDNLSAVQSDPWNSPEEMWNRSPLKYADKCVTPTLFIQSDEDYRCWMCDAIQMFTALRMHGCPTRMCLFHGENHELSRNGKPKHRVRRLKEITDWFDTYLKA